MGRIVQYVKYFSVFFLAILGAFQVSMNYLVNRNMPDNTNTESAQSAAYYFSYGANMSPKYLRNIRNVGVIESKSARLNGYKLTFNLQGPNFLEPGFANIVASHNDRVEGVVHLLSPSDLNRIVESEPDEYLIANIDVYHGATLIKAKTLIYLKGEAKEYRPSKRYLSLLVDAGEQYSFSEEYLDQLRNRDVAYYPAISELFGSLVYAFVMLAAR